MNLQHQKLKMEHNMKKRLIRFVTVLTIFSVLVYQSNILRFIKGRTSTAFAVGDLSVDWGVASGDPIFVVSNWLPGDSETRSIVIKNNSAFVRPVGVRGVKTLETQNLSTVVDFVVEEGVNILYTNTLAQFFIDSAGPSGLFLFNLNPGEEKTVDFTALFQINAGNEYQNAEIIFDLIIGISIDLPEACDDINLTGSIIYGTFLEDNLNGTNRNDIILAFEGNDKVEPSNGDDCVIGGPGADTIQSNNGNDVYDGGEGNDILNGGNGTDIVLGGGGDDIIEGGNQNDRLFGGDGNDKITGGNGNDYIEGNGGNDDLTGGTGNDTLLGGDGIDKVTGGAQTDTCEAETETSCEL